MAGQLTESAEAASSQTLDAFAELICALAPEVCSVSFHDFAADTLLMSEDFLLPEDHRLVEECLAQDAAGMQSVQYGTHEGSRYSVAIPVRDASGEVNGAVRLTIDSQISEARTQEPLEQRLAPVMLCLAAEFERRRTLPLVPSEEEDLLEQRFSGRAESDRDRESDGDRERFPAAENQLKGGSSGWPANDGELERRPAAKAH